MRRSAAPEPEPPEEREPAPARVPARRDPVEAFFSGLMRLALLVFVIGVFVSVAGLSWLSHMAEGLPDQAWVTEQPRRPSVVVLDRVGREIARRGPYAARDVTVAELPPYLIGAVLAIEDRRFYDHHGVDVRGLVRAGFENLRAGRVVQGGSTLTQQLAKNVLLDNERTLERKLREAVIATWLESRYSKDEILELYLNRVYFGSGAYGVEAASERYFGKPAAEVTIGEAAMLAGLLKAPSDYSPRNNVDLAADRTTLVLEAMAEAGVITTAELDAAFAEPILVDVGGASEDRGAGWFADWVVEDAQALAGADRDLVVLTTLDLDAQGAANRAVVETLAGAEDRGATQAALVALEGDGAVRAMIGGRSYAESQFNRAVDSRRQPGSAFKPFVYAAAIEAGLSPWDVRSDAPIEVEGWSPQNFDEEFQGEVTLITALAESINTVAVRVAEEIGRERVVRLVKRVGFDSRIRSTPSMALGSHGASAVELTSAYAAFANGGYGVEPYAIARIDSLQGDLLWRRQAPASVRGIEPRTVRLMNLMMSRVVTEGTGKGAALPDRPSAGKTGTSNDFRDAWYVGYVPGFVAGVWVGDDQNRPMERVTGGALPAAIWRAFMMEALEGVPVTPLDMDDAPAQVAASEPLAARPAPASQGGHDAEARRELDELLTRVQGY